MNLIELYDSLSIPEDGREKSFNAVPISEYPNFRIAMDTYGNPVLLFSVDNAIKTFPLKNFRFKYLQLEQNVECRISENGKKQFQSFTVITFTGTDRNLQEYFLRISETLIKSLSNIPSQHHVIDSLNKFVEIFRALSDTPTKTVQGLWTELFLIDQAKNPKLLLSYWHNSPQEKFDFNAGEERIEVKSSANFERIHTFSSEQLNPPSQVTVLIASIFIKQQSNGSSIQNLVDSISNKVDNDIILISKLNTNVLQTLGNSFEQSIAIKFDYNVAKDSLRYYWQKNVSKIEEIHIPNEVSEVRYKSDLSSIKPVSSLELTSKGKLFQSI